MPRPLPRSIKFLDFTVVTISLITVERIAWVVLNWPDDPTLASVLTHLLHLPAPVGLTVLIVVFTRRVHREHRATEPAPRV